MENLKAETNTTLMVAAHLLYIACDLLEKEGEAINKVFFVAREIDGIGELTPVMKPISEFTKDELIATVKAYRRILRHKSDKREAT